MKLRPKKRYSIRLKNNIYSHENVAIVPLGHPGADSSLSAKDLRDMIDLSQVTGPDLLQHVQKCRR